MTHPTDKAIAQAFRELVECDELAWPVFPETFREDVYRRARRLDAEKCGEVADHEYQRGVCVHCGMEAWMGGECSGPREATPPAQAAEAVSLETLLSDMERTDPYQDVSGSAVLGWAQGIRAAIAAMQAGE